MAASAIYTLNSEARSKLLEWLASVKFDQLYAQEKQAKARFECGLETVQRASRGLGVVEKTARRLYLGLRMPAPFDSDTSTPEGVSVKIDESLARKAVALLEEVERLRPNFSSDERYTAVRLREALQRVLP